MKLAQYLEKKRISQRQFAERTGLSESTVSFLVRDMVWISRDAAQRIAAATRGKVTANDFVRREEVGE